MYVASRFKVLGCKVCKVQVSDSDLVFRAVMVFTFKALRLGCQIRGFGFYASKFRGREAWFREYSWFWSLLSGCFHLGFSSSNSFWFMVIFFIKSLFVFADAILVFCILAAFRICMFRVFGKNNKGLHFGVPHQARLSKLEEERKSGAYILNRQAYKLTSHPKP